MNLKDLRPTERFSSRVTDYVLYRPSYPSALLDFLDQSVIELKGNSVADFGAGTGIFSSLLLERGATVFAVEPNKEMLNAAIKTLNSYPNFHPTTGSAEKSHLPSASINLITCAQAFHWFDIKKARTEFDRILKSNGRIALIWNYLNASSPLSQAYDKVKVEICGEKLVQVNELTGRLNISLDAFFQHRGFEHKIFDNFQDLSQDGLLGRFFSTSYAPLPQDSLGKKAADELKKVFEKYSKDGLVRLDYKTENYIGR